MNRPRPIEPPKEPWVDRLRKGHIVWLPKERTYAAIVFAYEPPEPGFRVGRIGLSRAGSIWCEAWHISLDGEGIDGSRIMMPTEGNLPEEAAPLSPVWVRHVEQLLAHILHRLEQLETAVYSKTDL